MSESVRWLSAPLKSNTDDLISPRTIQPKTSPRRLFINRSSTQGPPTSPTPSIHKNATDGEEENKLSPLRSTAGGSPLTAISPSGQRIQSNITSSSQSNFKLQGAPKPKKRPSGYFSAPKATLEDEGIYEQGETSSPRINPTINGLVTPNDRRSKLSSEWTSDNARFSGLRFENGDDVDFRQSSFFSRLKALATPTDRPATDRTHTERPTSDRPSGSHKRNASTGRLSYASSDRDDRGYHSNHADGSEVEGDVEENSELEDGVPTTRKQRRRTRHRLKKMLSSTEPSTSIHNRLPSFVREHNITNPTSFVHTRNASQDISRSNLFRRSTMNDISENERAGVSEDEGRERIAKKWRRSLAGAKTMTQSQLNKRTDRATSPVDPNRPSPFRRLTAFAAFDGTSSPFRNRTERHGSLGAQKWRQVKAGLKMLGQKKEDARVRIDYEKSAELMAELLAGAPAALFLASMYQRDDDGRQKIPALLEQLKISVLSSSTREDKVGDSHRHILFNIGLEYGNGPSRMTWNVVRSLRDFANLHLKYKLQSQTEKYNPLKGDDRHKAKIPRFPRGAFPYLRGFRGLVDEDFTDEEPAQESGVDNYDQERPNVLAARKRRHSSLSRMPSFHRRKPSSSAVNSDGQVTADDTVGPAQSRTLYPDRQRKKLEVYLQQMVRWLIFRPDSTRLCKFLELSALAMRLSVEGGYHGKEGLLTITSKRSFEGHGLRAIKSFPHRLKTMPARHKPKWFLVRDSYITAVESPESLLPTEVFLVDSEFTTDKNRNLLGIKKSDSPDNGHVSMLPAQPQHHILKLHNSERKLRLLARNDRQLAQFKESVEFMAKNSVWSKRHRFESFAPVRKNVFARWLVDGRDYMWQVSRAIDNARSFIYIHDWWLSPEVYLRRPAAISQRWRLDRLLLEKARQGVKIFVIVYRNIESAVPIDSEHTKTHLLELHPNICVQRSPNQFRQNQFFWAHHEKLVVVDNAMSFVGGIDLCFGRWDDSHHVLTDDKLTGFERDFKGPRNATTCQSWPGKDYANTRVQDFYALGQPYEEMYDRTRVPRMPWHDVAMCMVGQPARDVARHFVQRWNYILRQRTPTRPTPVLLPPPEFDQEELDKMGMSGTCQIQVLRSCAAWSIGTPNKVECSIMNAYEHLIRNSDHFVYIENQFFITSCTVEGTKINNRIGDALVERIELAHERGDKWRACLLVPLMPDFQNSVDSQDGTSIRLIMQCQYRSICRGETSIFARLRSKGIDPAQYIEFYALRQWGKIGPNQVLTTEQLYVHAKCMVVDDRSCIIGSANINERSMLGNRDSEMATLIIDQETIPSTMGGEPYRVGVFPHSLRMRLMREHLGVDIDEFYRQDEDSDDNDSAIIEPLIQHPSQALGSPIVSPRTPQDEFVPKQKVEKEDQAILAGVNPQKSLINKTGTEILGHVIFGPKDDDRARTFGEKLDLDLAGFGVDNAQKLTDEGVSAGRESFVNTLGQEVLATSPETLDKRCKSSHIKSTPPSGQGTPQSSTTPPWSMKRMSTQELGLTQLSQLPALPISDDTDIGGPPILQLPENSPISAIAPLIASICQPYVENDCMKDPLKDDFYKSIWHQIAVNNTKLYRQVFRCMPDSEVQSWKDYREYNIYSEKFMQSQGAGQGKPKPPKDAANVTGPPGTSVADGILGDVMSGGGSATKRRLSEFANKFLRPGSRASERDWKSDSTVDDKEKRIRSMSMSDFDEKTVQKLQTDDIKKDQSKSAGTSPNPATNQSSLSPDPAKGTPTPENNTEKHDPSLDNNKSTNPRGRNVTFSADATPIMSPSPDHTTEKHHVEPSGTSETTAIQSNPTGIVPESTAIGASGIGSIIGRRRRATTIKSGRSPFAAAPEEVLDKDNAETMLNLVRGHLVLWPYDWLVKEEKGGNWLYNIDQIAPLEIYD